MPIKHGIPSSAPTYSAKASKLAATPTPDRSIAASKLWVRQASCACDRAPHSCADHGLAPFGKRRHIESNELWSRGCTGIYNRLRIGTPSATAVLSAIEWTRRVDAIRQVRSGVAQPRCTGQPASMNSDATTRSTSPSSATWSPAASVALWSAAVTAIRSRLPPSLRSPRRIGTGRVALWIRCVAPTISKRRRRRFSWPTEGSATASSGPNNTISGRNRPNGMLPTAWRSS